MWLCMIYINFIIQKSVFSMHDECLKGYERWYILSIVLVIIKCPEINFYAYEQRLIQKPNSYVSKPIQQNIIKCYTSVII